MKKSLLLLLMMGGAFQAHAIDLKGDYLSQSGELMFRFTSDSLYVDIAQSHRNVSAFKLIKKSDSKEAVTFDAFEHFLQNGQETYREVLIRVSPEGEKKYLLEYFGKDKDREYNYSERYHIKPIE